MGHCCGQGRPGPHRSTPSRRSADIHTPPLSPRNPALCCRTEEQPCDVSACPQPPGRCPGWGGKALAVPLPWRVTTRWWTEGNLFSQGIGSQCTRSSGRTSHAQPRVGSRGDRTVWLHWWGMPWLLGRAPSCPSPHSSSPLPAGVWTGDTRPLAPTLGWGLCRGGTAGQPAPTPGGQLRAWHGQSDAPTLQTTATRRQISSHWQ